jgi:hypothetical protein
MRTDDALLEREDLLARVAGLMERARQGVGQLLVVEGPAGIGKTAVLAAAGRRADGFTVLRARGGELERGFPHGVVRQLFEAHVRVLDPDRRAQALGGAAELAAPVVAPDLATTPGGSADPSFAIDHGLYWLTANLAEQHPVLLSVDDAHWSDLASLRFLAHLARRLEGLPVLLAVGIRSGEPDSPEDLLAELRSHAEVAHPDPLSEHAVAGLLARGLQDEPDEGFVAACRAATGGTPFLLRELIDALDRQGVAPTRDGITHVAQTGPRTVAAATLARLRRLPPAATELARAIAVLGADGRLNVAAALAGIDEPAAVEVADALTAMHILRPERPLDFVHPIVRSAIYDDIPPAARAAGICRRHHCSSASQRTSMPSPHTSCSRSRGRARQRSRSYGPPRTARSPAELRRAPSLTFAARSRRAASRPRRARSCCWRWGARSGC